MKSSLVIPGEAQDRFWHVVKRCVHEFHPKNSSSVLTKVNRLRKKVENLPIDEMELFFHSEPFDVACRLASHPLEVENYLERYLEIRDEEDIQDG
jgi:hypothetical protein